MTALVRSSYAAEPSSQTGVTAAYDSKCSNPLKVYQVFHKAGNYCPECHASCSHCKSGLRDLEKSWYARPLCAEVLRISCSSSLHTSLQQEQKTTAQADKLAEIRDTVKVTQPSLCSFADMLYTVPEHTADNCA